MLKLKDRIRSLVVLTVVAACSSTAAAQGSQKSARQAQDEAAIRENVRQMEEGWNTKNGTLYAQPFADDAEAIPIGGQFFKGREALEEAHWRMFEGVYKNSTITMNIKQVRFLRPDVALVQVQGTNKWQRGESKDEYGGSITLVMTKDGGRWKIVSFQNTMVGPPAWQQRQK